MLLPDHRILDFIKIEPFSPEAIRPGMISYGLTSYGYDVRVGNKYKIFTNVNTEIIDPKNFSPKAFVDHEGDHCIIPPNSFALASSLETFEIHRQVLAICLGKSTYARCFSGDTKIALVDGTSPTFVEMIDQSELFWGYSVNEHGRLIITQLEMPRYIGKDTLIEIELDNGKSIKCTPDHGFLMRNGCMYEAKDLRPGDSLFPLYRYNSNGYESIFQPCLGYPELTHKLANDWNLRNSIYEEQSNMDCHHIDENKRNNNPWNIEQKESIEHIKYHNLSKDSSHLREYLELQRYVNPLFNEEWKQIQKGKADSFWHDEKYKEIRERLLINRQNMSIQTRIKMSETQLKRYQDHRERVKLSQAQRKGWKNSNKSRRMKQVEIAENINKRQDVNEELILSALNEAGSIRGAARILNCDRSVFRRFPQILSKWNNHKIVSIRELKGQHDVFCLTSPETGLFGLDCGVIVQNCGIIVNVTPLEPEWRGKITIEISNTTPLPCKVYSNEGIAQILFLYQDDAVMECRKSYADKKGRYQDQKDLTLPFVSK